MLTDRTMCERPLVAVVADAVMSGARAVVLREKDLPYEERARIAAPLRFVLDPVGDLLVMADPRGDAVTCPPRTLCRRRAPPLSVAPAMTPTSCRRCMASPAHGTEMETWPSGG